MSKNKSLRFFIAICLAFLLSGLFCGCALVAGTADSVRRAGLTPASRKTLLIPSVTKYNEAIGWGDISLALTLTTEEYRPILRDYLLKNKDKVKVINTEVDLTEYGDAAWEASVFVTFKAYRIPFYIAEEFKEKQIWKFSLTDGWRIDSKEPLSAS